jgi:mRNA-degrading endonuclease HigB of HigAB toxin-antitoxin module
MPVIISKKRIKEANSKRSGWKASLQSWHKIAKAADWKNFPGVKQSWRNVDLVGIDIANNRARLVAHVDYKYHLVFYSVHRRARRILKVRVET